MIFLKFILSKNKITEKINLKEFKLKSDAVLEFKLSKSQVEQIIHYKNLFGTTLEGISRIISRIYVKQFLRSTGAQTNVQKQTDLPSVEKLISANS